MFNKVIKFYKSIAATITSTLGTQWNFDNLQERPNHQIALVSKLV